MSALLTAGALVLGACTNAGEDPAAVPSTDAATPGATASPRAPGTDAPSVAVVLPARAARSDSHIEQERAAVDRIAEAAIGDGTVATVRTVVPDRTTTIGDVVEVLAEEGHDLVCALGPGAARAIRDAAVRFPGTRFCGAPGNLPSIPDNALLFDLRAEESAYLAGIAAGEAASFIGSDAGSTAAIIVADSSQASRLQLAFDQGFAISREASAPTEVRVATSQAVGQDTAENLYASGTYLIYASAGRVELGVIEAAKVRDRLVIGTLPPSVIEEDDEDDATPSDSPTSPAAQPWALMFLGEDLSAAFRDTMDELRAGWRGGQRSLGFRNGALTLTPGSSPLWSRIAAQVLTTRDALVAGTDLQIAGGTGQGAVRS